MFQNKLSPWLLTEFLYLRVLLFRNDISAFGIEISHGNVISVGC